MSERCVIETAVILPDHDDDVIDLPESCIIPDDEPRHRCEHVRTVTVYCPECEQKHVECVRCRMRVAFGGTNKVVTEECDICDNGGEPIILPYVRCVKMEKVK